MQQAGEADLLRLTALSINLHLKSYLRSGRHNATFCINHLPRMHHPKSSEPTFLLRLRRFLLTRRSSCIANSSASACLFISHHHFVLMSCLIILESPANTLAARMRVSKQPATTFDWSLTDLSLVERMMFHHLIVLDNTSTHACKHTTRNHI
jgi:hypothetical protein